MATLPAPFVQAVTTVDDTAGGTIVLAAGRRNYLLIQNTGANECYISLDGSAVTTANGFHLPAGSAPLEFRELSHNKAIKAICSSSESTTVVVASF